jgi:chemotaxis protein MotB
LRKPATYDTLVTDLKGEIEQGQVTNVDRFLQDEVGIAPALLQAVGMSEFHPVATNKTLVGRSQNRRIEIALLPDLRELPGAAKSTIKE